MHRDAVFRGCTRPAMFLGVPCLPFFAGTGACLLLALYVDLLLLAVLPPLVFAMRQMARRDEMVFRLLGLRWRMGVAVRNRALRGGHWSFAPLAGRARRARR